MPTSYDAELVSPRFGADDGIGSARATPTAPERAGASAKTMPVVEVRNLTKEYRLGALHSLKQTVLNAAARLTGAPSSERPLFKALDDVTFSINRREVVGIIGHNGAGKSTLLKMLARVSTPTRGSVNVTGRIAPLIEVGAGFVPDFTGRENVYLNGAILGMSRREVDRKFDEIVEFAEMADFIDTPVKRYSSGMQVKLAFSIATSVEAEVLIIDEVLAVGDLAFQQKCIDRIETLIHRDERTVIIVGHNIRQIQRICSRVILMDQGRITADGEPSQICSAFFKEAQEKNVARHQTPSGQLAAMQASGIASLISIGLMNDASEETTFAEFHKPLTVVLTLECERPVPRAEIVIGLHTSDFVHVMSVSNAAEAIRDLPAGRSQVRCRLADIPLRPFTYALRIGILDQYRQMLWYGENLKTVIVSPGVYDVTKLPEIGLVDIPAKWEQQTSSLDSP